MPPAHVVLARHGETEWSRNGRHTSRTDVPLTDRGREEAVALGDALRRRGDAFALVLVSPLRRARVTCDLAGFGARAVVDADLTEWDYGDDEGRTTAEIRETRPGWSVWTHDVPGGESAADVGARADRVLARLDAVDGDVALFAHAHLLRVLAARWLGLPPVEGRLLALDTATLSVLGWEREARVVREWNLRV